MSGLSANAHLEQSELLRLWVDQRATSQCPEKCAHQQSQEILRRIEYGHGGTTHKEDGTEAQKPWRQGPTSIWEKDGSDGSATMLESPKAGLQSSKEPTQALEPRKQRGEGSQQDRGRIPEQLQTRTGTDQSSG